MINLGVTFGAGLYETRIVVPLWFHPEPGGIYWVDTVAMQRMDVGRRFWGLVTTLPLSLLTLINLYYAWQAAATQKTWWLAAVILILIERVGTFAFFIPTAIRLQRADSLPSQTVSRLSRRWMLANYGRIVLTLLGWLLTLKALHIY